MVKATPYKRRALLAASIKAFAQELTGHAKAELLELKETKADLTKTALQMRQLGLTGVKRGTSHLKGLLPPGALERDNYRTLTHQIKGRLTKLRPSHPLRKVCALHGGSIAKQMSPAKKKDHSMRQKLLTAAAMIALIALHGAAIAKLGTKTMSRTKRLPDLISIQDLSSSMNLLGSGVKAAKKPKKSSKPALEYSDILE